MGRGDAEWMAVPESFVLTAGALHQAKFALGGMVVDETRMLRNLGMSQGLIVGEAVMMGLAPHIGRQQAHDAVYAACRAVADRGGTLADALLRDPEIVRHVGAEGIARLTDPANYLGQASQMVEKASGARERES